MPIRVKTGTSTWSVIKKVYAKINTGSTGWRTATKIFAKLPTGWIQVWPGDAPSSSLTDPINIRRTGYSGPIATSPEFINTILYGNDGTINGAQPITVNVRRMRISEDDSGNTTRYTLETVDVYNLTSNNETNIGFKRYMADGWWLFYELIASNVDSPYPPGTTLYSPPIKLIKQPPTFNTNSPSLSEDYSVVDPFFSVSFSFSDTWWKSVDLSRSYVKWWRNTSKSPGGTPIKTTLMNQISGLSNTRSGDYSEYNGTGTTISGNDYHTEIGGIPAGQYIIAEVVLINSYTDTTSPVSSYVTTGEQPVITSVEIKGVEGYAEYVMDNQATPRIISDGLIEIVAQVSDYQPNTVFNFEPRMYNADPNSSISYINYTTGASISDTSFPTDLSPTSITTSGTTATVKWQTSIPANGSTVTPSGPTFGGGQSRYYFEFRISATAPGKAIKYYVGTVSNMGQNIGYIFEGSQASIPVAPSTLPTLTATPTSGGSPLTVTFGVSATSYPSGYASYPRSYIISFGDGTAEVVSFATGTNNPTSSNWTHTYNNTGTYTARLYWNPQGRLSRGTNQRSITIGSFPSTPTFLSATTNRTDGVNLEFSGSSGATSYDIFWNTAINVPPLASSNPDFTGVSSPFLDTTIGSGNTRWYWVRGRNSTGTSAWYPTTNGIQGTRTAAPAPTITSLTASAPTTTSQQLVTVTVNWSSTNQASYFLNVFQAGVANYQDTGTTATSSNTSDAGSLFRVYSGTSATIDLTVYSGAGQTGTSATQSITYTPPLSQTTYGLCEFWYSYDSYECSSIYNRDTSTTYYKRKVYVDGVWDGSTYDYSESACVPFTTYGSYKLTNGRCGYTEPAYQYYCTTNYRQAGIPNDQYTSSADESAVVCDSYRTVCSYNNTGSYPSASEPPACATTTTTTTTTTACVCVYQDMGTYHYSPQCCPSGSARSGSLSGTTSGSCCPNVNKTQKWNCNTFDVNNSTSANYYLCFSVGECAATSNSAGTRTTCYV